MAIGEYIDTLEKIKGEEFLKYTYSTKAIYQLTGKNLNITFYATKHQCIFVKIEQR